MKKNAGLSLKNLRDVFFIYLFVTISPTIFYAIHCKKEFSLKKFIGLLILIQTIGLYFTTKQLYNYHQEGLKSSGSDDIKKAPVKSQYLFVVLAFISIVAQLSNIILDTVFNIGYFTYSKIKTSHYIEITLLCVLIGLIPIIINEYIYNTKVEKNRKRINEQSKKLNHPDAITQTAIPLTKATVIYSITVVCPTILSCIHAAYNLKPQTIIIFIVLIQLTGTVLIIGDLYTYKKSCIELESYLQKITKENHKNQNTHINTKQFSGVICAVLIGQFIAAGIDTIVSRLYFSYEMINTTQYVSTILACAFAGVLIPLSYEYVCCVKDSIMTEIIDVQTELIKSEQSSKTLCA